MKVTKEKLKKAIIDENWNLLDLLLENDSSEIDYDSMFGDDWGEYWTMLMHCVLRKYTKGVKILLKHGANPDIPSWGDGFASTPYSHADEGSEIYKLLTREIEAKYIRKS